MCFVQDWSIGLWLSATILWLSLETTGVKRGIWNLDKRDWIQINSATLRDKLQYSASALEPATMSCFWDQDTVLGPKKMQELNVGHLPSRSDAQYAS